MAISAELGIRPWEQRELLTVDEFDAAVAYIDAINESASEKGR